MGRQDLLAAEYAGRRVTWFELATSGYRILCNRCFVFFVHSSQTPVLPGSGTAVAFSVDLPSGNVAWLPNLANMPRVFGDVLRHDDFPLGLDPWPVQAGGQGLSLHRVAPEQYSDDPANWTGWS